MISERDIDDLIKRLLLTDGYFRDGFLKLANLPSQKHSPVSVETQTRHKVNTGSIDIEARFGSELALLIENKINARYSITNDGAGQPIRYRQSVDHLRNMGIQAVSILIAPRCYFQTSTRGVEFDCCISYENIVALTKGGDRDLLLQAIEQAENPYVPVEDAATSTFFAEYRKYVNTNYPELVLKREPNENRIRPMGSHTIYFEVRKTLLRHTTQLSLRMSLQCWDSGAHSPSVKIMIGRWGQYSSILQPPDSLRAINGYIRRASESLGIVIDTPRLEPQLPLEAQLEEARQGLEAAQKLRNWWNSNTAQILEWNEIVKNL